ncbi:PREDICTED: phospholipase A2 inhibitor and Ly6/PLAUR domain-containing protein [Hipposideros armiger]|uniref:Phospholipase A2 inhibitor and Ly6/PLAUR domain-containing protein n=1 Tax=Hipposideros armiger TaxID=186990 RepID=A0A8B7Q019_HIPAR|nr:PREDICTED: phospholipase A2 inhibitor and Ly6/PLAUR domain-containing protein [Hipposideros armiger]
MLGLFPALALLGALATPAGTSRTCPDCSLLGNCTERTCPHAQDSCLFSQMQLENGTLIKNGSCVSPRECREGVYALTYGPHSSFWVTMACCDNCSQVTQPEAGPNGQPNGMKCHYCSGDKLAPCDSTRVMNCTGHQTVCVTLNGTWSGGSPQILKGCATPDFCKLQVNTTLGLETSGFHLMTGPECNYGPPTPQPEKRGAN